MDWELFIGDGQAGQRQAPAFVALPELDDAEGYLADAGLRDAVNVAILLGQPLLVTGEPGTGKTLLAKRVAYEFSQAAPLVFIARTTSAANDLFYTYDALRRFMDSQSGDEKAQYPQNYVTVQALGLAILLALPPAMANPYLPERYRNTGPLRSVVLIDEIDKAPRDLPNDILNEVDRMEFLIKETGKMIPDFAEEERRLKEAMPEEKAQDKGREYRQTFEMNRPILILTSNDEKRLPDAFLRRCLYYNIAFPDLETDAGKKALRDILERRLRTDLSGEYLSEDYLNAVLKRFDEIRKELREKKPATAELIAWTRMLAKKGIPLKKLNQPDTATAAALKTTLTALVKSAEDGNQIIRYLDSLPGSAGAGKGGR